MVPLTPLRFITALLGHDEAATQAVRATLRQDEIDWRRVIWLSSSHMVLPSVTAALHRQGVFARVPTELGEALGAARCLNRERNHMLRAALTERAAESRPWSRGFRLYDDALRLPRRLWGLGVRLVQAPGYFPARAKAWWQGRATANTGHWR